MLLRNFFLGGIASFVLILLSCWAAGAEDPQPPSPSSLPRPIHSILGPSWVSRPLLSTNAAASTFLQNHPELNEPPPPIHPNEDLSIHPPSSISPLESPIVLPSKLFLLNSMGQPDDLAAHLLVVYNSNDPDSKPLADYYAHVRNIPSERVLSIACPTNEEISRSQYNEMLREPIISYLYRMKWMERRNENVRVGNHLFDLLVATRNDIWAIVLMRGVPLKIASDLSNNDEVTLQPELRTNAAAVDSELALLPIFGLPLGGFVPNTFFDGDSISAIRVGPELATKIILVSRLDGPTPADVRRMIDDSLYAEKNRLVGLAVIDTRGITDEKNNYILGDLWLRKSGATLAADGWTLETDETPDPIPPTDPCNQVALYLGWYAENASGPWITLPNRFVRGAIAYHLHSFSANTVRSPTQNWVGPLIAHGAAATMGCVYEPYLTFTPHLDIFTRRLLDGNYFAEAAYASQPSLSWMTTVVGDPLYRPFIVPLKTAVAKADSNASDHRDWLLLQLLQRNLLTGRIPRTSEALEHALDLPGTGAVAHEYLGDLLAKLHNPQSEIGAEAAYKEAMALNSTPIDQIRVGLKLAQLEAAEDRKESAQQELKNLSDRYPQDADRFGMKGLVPSTQIPPAELIEK